MSGASVWLPYITPVIAVSGLALSVLSLVLRQRDNKPLLKVSASGPITEFVEDDSKYRVGYHVIATNSGQVPITVVDFHVDCRDSVPQPGTVAFGVKKIDSNRDLPCKLEASDHISFKLEGREIRESLENSGVYEKSSVKLVFRDTLGNRYVQPVTIEFTELL